MDVDAITRLIIRTVPAVADRAFAAREQWGLPPSDGDAKLIREYLDLVAQAQVLGQYQPVKSIGDTLTSLDEVQQFSLLYTAKLDGDQPASLAIQAIAVAVRKFRENWAPYRDSQGSGSTTPGVFGAFTEDLAELRERVESLQTALHNQPES